MGEEAYITSDRALPEASISARDSYTETLSHGGHLWLRPISRTIANIYIPYVYSTPIG